MEISTHLSLLFSV